MAKIIVTGYPSLGNAIEALNKGADSYIIKPVDIDKMLATVEQHLERQRNAQKMTQDQLVQFIETRVRQLEHERLNTT